MKSEEEVKELYEKLKEIAIITHPSVLHFAEWILEVGDKKEQKMWLEIIDGIVESRRRLHN